ncbi:endo-beta-N-acetylglucosaminidase [Clostridium sp. LIBA-8841]|uniref:endo-beta-N-acetylglucosaminidase n=1 Tax=Clostridium sp. LIBA-8841 TaxID=2987530 RepID=UPI002AC3D042|nr:discoidin domain-containing protein [Clostridium sp. LIBA-8841]MDZ5253954.1 discoidin domain-containing protein [Clostridium sp. LIBA-8841]
MRKRGIMSKRLLAALCMASVTTSLFGFGGVEVKASPNIPYDQKESLAPLGEVYSIETLLNWNPESDPDAKYNRASIELQDRFMGDIVNENAHPEAKIMNVALTNPYVDKAPSQGSDSMDAYVFSYWQYVNSYVYWGGSSRGIFALPTPDVVDNAHKNGVPVLATIGFPWGPGEGYAEQVRSFLQKDENGNFPVADKMIEIAEYYGFDGYFFNQESYGCVKDDADRMIEMLEYIKKKAPNMVIGWYDSMTVDGNVKWQDALNSKNAPFFQNGENRTTDEFFLNYNWTPEKVETSVSTAVGLGRSPFDVYAGLDVQQNAYNTPFNDDYLLDENGKLRLSLAMYTPNSTFSMAKDVYDFYNHDQKFWVGPTGDPSKSDTEQDWVGLANYVPDRSAINDLPFVTNFNLGHGEDYYIDGSLSRDEEWNNRAMQEYLPTWRWIVESNGPKLSPDFDFKTAYNGGSSLKVEGNLEAANPNHIKLYSTDLAIENNSTELSIVYKTDSVPNMKVGLCFGENYDEENFTFFDVNAVSNGAWTEVKIPLGDHIGKTISAISLKFESQEDIENYKINVGQISIEETAENNKGLKNSNVVLEETMVHNANSAEARIYWDGLEAGNDDDLAFYEIYRIKPDGSKELMGATPNDAYYVQEFNRYGEEMEFDIEVVPVDVNYNRGEGKKVTFNWGIPNDATEIPEEENLVNFALNMPVKVSAEGAAEPGIKAVDGTVDNNSKWCAAGVKEGWLEIDLQEPKTIQRWVVMHGEEGGEAKDTNTKDFALEVSYDGGETYEEVDVVTGNQDAVTDRNLAEPIVAQHLRLRIDDSGDSPWAAIRIYEFQLYEDTFVDQTTEIPMRFVDAKNNKGANDSVLVTRGKEGQTVNLYKSLNDETPFVTSTIGANGEAKFEGLDFGKDGGRIYYGIVEEGKEESLRMSVPFEGEEWEYSKAPENFELIPYKAPGMNGENPNYGTLKIEDLEAGDVVSIFSSADSIFPDKVSIPVAKGGDTAILDRIPVNQEGGVFILEVKTEGKKARRIEVPYSGFGEITMAIEEGAPKNLRTIDVQKKSVSLAWDVPENTYGLDGYIIYKDNKMVGEVSMSETEFTVEKLNRHTIYNFKVAAKYSNGEISERESITVRTAR